MTKTTTASPSAQLSSVSGRARLQRVPRRSGRLMGVVAAIALAAACTGQATNPTEPTATTTTDFSLMFANFHVGPSSTFDVHLFAQGRSGEAFALSSDSPSVTVPAWVTTDDKRHGMVVAQMHDVTEITRVTITARRNEKQAVASVTLLPPPSLVTPAASVIGGDTIRVTYTPSQPRDYSRDLLLSSTSAAARVEPAAVTLAAGASSIIFDVVTQRVVAETPVTLSAMMSGVTSTVELQLLPPLAQLAAFSVAPARVRGGGDASGLVTLSAAAPPTGTVVTLAASLRDAEVPATFTIAPGATTGTFRIVTRPPYARTTVIITATVENERRIATLEVETVPPVAQDDSATIDAQRTLSVPAPGVLSNDLSPSGRPLTAELVRSVAHGTMILEANGAFSYQPTREFSGTDTFTYRTYDGPVRGNTATVTITVVPAPVRTKTLPFAGSDESSFVVPAGVTSITIAAYGAAGGAGTDGTAGGLGGRTTVTVRVTPGETLRVLVGGQGGAGGPAVRGTAGVIGGGSGGLDGLASGGGGGSGSGVARGEEVLVIAGGAGGGGGGSAGVPAGAGGAGGGVTGGAGGSPVQANSPTGGGGGTANAGGAGGAGATTVPAGLSGRIGSGAAAFSGGDGADGTAAGAGGGGGGGLFGGGGGGGGNGGAYRAGAGGGGGSSYAGGGATGVVHTQGIWAGHGQVVITW